MTFSLAIQRFSVTILSLPGVFPGRCGEVPERSKGTDCKSVAGWLRRFESSSPHHISAGVAQLARASAFQAEGRGFESRFPLHIFCGIKKYAHVAQSVEHVLGKDGVTGSSPVVGSIFYRKLFSERRKTNGEGKIRKNKTAC